MNDSDSIDEPTDELFAPIRTYLQGRLDAEDLHLDDFARIAVGWSHETFLFDARWTDEGATKTMPLCVRRDPGNALVREMSDLTEQFKVLRALEKTDIPSPKAYWLEDDPSILGGTFIVMEKVDGVCPNPWGRDGRTFYEDAAARGVLPNSFTDALAAIHNADWRAAGLDFLGVPGPGQDFVLAEIAKWETLIEAAEHPAEPVLTDLIGWLKANAPSTDRLSLVHGAYRTGNMLVDHDRVSAVLDWELQVIGDPMYDVSYVLSDLNRQGSDLLSYLVERDAFIERYEAATGITVNLDACRYYDLLYAMRSCAFWMSASGLFMSDQNTDLRLARTAFSVPVVLDLAARHLGY